MKFYRVACSLVAGIASFATAAQTRIDATLETYFLDGSAHSGFSHYLSWGELNARLNTSLKLTLSGLRTPSSQRIDEACARLDSGNASVRVGRIRTAFGIDDWSELFYNGINHLPIVGVVPVVDSLSLIRDDAGLEVTVGGPELQVQAAAVDTNLSAGQVVPKQANHAIVRLQTTAGPAIIGIDAARSFMDQTAVYGMDLRLTFPRLLVLGEIMAGSGDDEQSWGYYVDGSYRIPTMARTQACLRTEGFAYEGAQPVHLETIGLRQVFSANFSLNINYGWGSASSLNYIAGGGFSGWSARAMFQLHF